jgi:hypothetical protein
LLAVATLVALAIPAQAQRQRQQPRQGFGQGRGGMDIGTLIASNKSVQEELKLSEDQIDKVKKASDEIRTKYRDEFQKVGMDREKMQELMTKIAKERTEVMDKLLPTVLKPEQAKRASQIELQVGGVRTLAKESVQKQLKLSDKQVSEIKEITAEIDKDVQALMGQMREARGNQEKMQEITKKMASMRKEGMDKATGVFNDDQKKAWKDMVGQPFEIKMEAPRRPQQL